MGLRSLLNDLLEFGGRKNKYGSTIIIYRE